MLDSEFSIIGHYFHTKIKRPEINKVGVGDDAAIIEVPVGQQLVTSIDSLNEGVHFFSNVAPFDLGYKSLAVSISDIASMGAEPFSALLSLTLPRADRDWLDAFSAGFFELANRFKIDLIGGDLSRGGLSVTTVVNGLVPQRKALLRSGARVGDRIYVTGYLGNAGLALTLLKEGRKVPLPLLQALHRPEPRVTAGLALRELAHSAMDLSDGLLADLSKLCQSSQVGAILFADQLPFSELLCKECDLTQARELALCSGDDYELVFTLAPERESLLKDLDLGVKVTCVGEIILGSSVTLKDAQDQIIFSGCKGYDHFSEGI